MTVDALVLNVVHWTLPRAGDAPMSTKVTILYTVVAVLAAYFLLPLCVILLPKVQPKYWLLWAFYYVVAQGFVCYAAASLGLGAIIALTPWAIGIWLRMLIPAGQMRERRAPSVESSGPLA